MLRSFWRGEGDKKKRGRERYGAEKKKELAYAKTRNIGVEGEESS